MKRIYVAGAYSADNPLEILDNMRRGINKSIEVFAAGLSPFSPWLDFQFHLMRNDNQRFTVQNYYDYSMNWLEVSDAVLVVEGWKNSRGTKAEIARAEELDIPIFYSLDDLLREANNG